MLIKRHSKEGRTTSKKLFSYGMWVCYSCGHLNSDNEVAYCAGCNHNKKFLVQDNFFNKKRKRNGKRAKT